MAECICNNCANLKNIIGEDGEMIESTCRFGFPSERCEDCNEDECSENCSNYEPYNEENKLRIVHCKGCGKELEKVFDEDTDGDVFCIECYLKSSD